MRMIGTLVVAAFFTVACSGERAGLPDGGTATADSAPAADAHTGDAHADERGETAEHGHAAAEPGEGMTLLAIMQKLGADMAALTHGMMTQDTALVARTASAVAEHSPIAPEELERIHGALGADVAEFDRLDEEVHEASVALSETARSGRMDAVLERLHEVQRGCVACHTQFRERLRTNPAR